MQHNIILILILHMHWSIMQDKLQFKLKWLILHNILVTSQICLQPIFSIQFHLI